MQELDLDGVRPPIIVIGMHRSGTSFLSSLLQRMNVYMGADTTRTEESRFFRTINERMLRRASATWYKPAPMWQVLADQTQVRMFARQIESECQSDDARAYFGDKSIANTNWGWKDPRSTITLPIWLELFPRTRVIHIVRNGIDVAASLLRRSQNIKQPTWKSRIRTLVQHTVAWKSPYRRPIEKHSFVDLDEAFDLWQIYLKFAESGTRELSPDNFYSLRFEDLADRPGKELDRLARFLSIIQTSSQIEDLAQLVNPQRAWSFENNTELAAFAERTFNAPMMKHYGYVPKSQPVLMSNHIVRPTG